MENAHQALLPPQVRLCSYRLRSYTLWAHTLLLALRSPFLAADPDTRITPGDLLLALRISSTPWRLDRHGTPRVPSLRPRLRDLLWRILLTLRPRLFHTRATWYLQWLRAHTVTPLLWRDEGGGSPGLTAPDTHAIVYALTSQAHLTEHRAWNTSLGHAQFILATVAELTGASVAFADPADLAAPGPYQPTTREEVLARARADLGPAAAAAFIAAWDAAHPAGA